MELATKLVQVGVGRDEGTGACISNGDFSSPGAGQEHGFDYSRTGNPARRAHEDGMRAAREDITLMFTFILGRELYD